MHLRSSPRGHDRAHGHINSSYQRNPSIIALVCYVVEIWNHWVRLSTLSAIQRTHADLATHNPSFIFFINSILIFCKTLRLGNAFKSKNCTVCHSLAFQSSFLCKLSFYNDFIWLSLVSYYHERLNLQLRMKMKPHHWFAYMFSCLVCTQSVV